MSFILDALKKSEQDRGNDAVPNVQTIHSSSLNYHQEKRAIWPWILIAVLIVNIALLIYFLIPKMNTEITSPESRQSEKNNATIFHENNVTIDDKPDSALAITNINPPQIQTSQTVEQKMPVAETTIEPTTPPQPVTQVMDINDLPASIRQQIPGMVFSAHVYSSDAMQRSLVINNRFMEEGEAVNRDLILMEITTNGAIFDYLGYRFSISVLSGWSTH